jgi:hypothetical protein
MPKNIWNVFVHSRMFNYTGICKKLRGNISRRLEKKDPNTIIDKET